MPGRASVDGARRGTAGSSVSPTPLGATTGAAASEPAVAWFTAVPVSHGQRSSSARPPCSACGRSFTSQHWRPRLCGECYEDGTSEVARLLVGSVRDVLARTGAAGDGAPPLSSHAADGDGGGDDGDDGDEAADGAQVAPRAGSHGGVGAGAGAAATASRRGGSRNRSGGVSGGERARDGAGGLADSGSSRRGSGRAALNALLPLGDHAPPIEQDSALTATLFPQGGQTSLPPPLPPHLEAARRKQLAEQRARESAAASAAAAEAAAGGGGDDSTGGGADRRGSGHLNSRLFTRGGEVPGLAPPEGASGAAGAGGDTGGAAGAGGIAGVGPARETRVSDGSEVAKRRVRKTKPIFGDSFEPVRSYRKRVVAKSAKSRSLIEEGLGKHFFFSTMGKEDVEEIVDAMSKRTYSVGEVVIEQGTLGDNFYIVEKGAFDVFVSGKKVGRVTTGGSFGELALLYNAPRAATVRAAVTSQVWALDRGTFRHIVAAAASKKLESSRTALRKVPLLQSLTEEQITKIAMAVQEVQFKKADMIIRKGDHGDAFYFLKEGDVLCTRVGTGARAMKDIPLHAGAYFGERALLLDEPRAANVIANADVVVCLRLDRLSVVQLLGPLRELFDHNMCINVLQSVPMLSALTDKDRDVIADGFITVTYEDGEEIMRQNEPASAFYVIRDGRVDVRHRVGGTAKPMLLASLSQGDYFGESALTSKDAQQQTVVAAGRVTCLVLDREVFEELLGPVEEVIAQRQAEAAAAAAAAEDEAAAGEGSVASGTGASLAAGGGEAGGGDSSAVDAGDGGGVGATTTGAHDAASHAGHGASSGAGAGAGSGAGADSDEEDAPVQLPLQHVRLEEFEAITTLGVGTFGRVSMVRQHGTANIYALKTLLKTRVVAHKQQRNVLQEKRAMARCNHPFIIKLFATYNEANKLHMLLECVQGGELFSLMASRNWLSSLHARFYAACIFLALRHIHERGFVFRDLKPENVLIDREGYLRVVDFGFAKRLHHAERTYTLCGTPEYLAPEIITGEGYDKAVDYWALGVLLYEMTCGTSPFADDDQMAVFRNILETEIAFPVDFTDRNAMDLIVQLLGRKPVQRIGCRKGGAADVQNHPWLAQMPWQDLLDKKLPAPWVPPLGGETDSRHFERYEAPSHGGDRDEVYRGDGTDWDVDF